MKLKLIFISIILLSSITGCFSQDTITPRIKEFYFSIMYFSPLNVQISYKKQVKNNIFFKIGLIDLSYTSGIGNGNGINGYRDNSSQGWSAGAEVGSEFRKKIYEKLSFYHGPNLNFTLSNFVYKSYNDALNVNVGGVTDSYKAAIPYTFGLLMNLTQHFYLSAELNPVVSLTINRSYSLPNTVYNSGYNSSFNFGLGNRVGLISLVYRK